jgi:hypothetical protein
LTVFGMNTKSVRLSLVNAALYLVTCALVGTGLLLELRLDEEDGAARLFGMGRDDWRENHIVIAIAFLAVTMLHLLVNRAWIKAAAARAAWAVPMVAVGVGLVAALLCWPTDREAAGRGTKAGQHEVDGDR